MGDNMTILEKQFYKESLFLEQIQDIENRILDEELDATTTSPNAHRALCEDSGVPYCICNADRTIQGGLI